MKYFNSRNSRALFLILEGIVYTMVLNLYNPFIQMFGKRLGAVDIHIALLNAAPPLIAVFVLIPFGILIERINRKKQTVMLLLLIYSFFFAAIAFVPAIPHQSKVIIYVILIGFMNWPGSLYLATWQSYFADNFTGSFASRVYSIRSKYSALFGLLTVLLTGLLLTNIPKSDEERLFLYQIFYGICFALTLLQLFLFSGVRESREKTGSLQMSRAGKPNEAHGTVSSLKNDFKAMIANKPYIIYCICGFVFYFSWQMAWPLFFIYNANYAGLNEFQLSLLSVAAGLTQFLTYTLWNKLIEKRGSSAALVLGTAGIALNPLFFLSLRSFPVIFAVNIFSGVFAAGFTLSIFCGLLEILPSNKKTIYISVFNTLTSITGFIAPIIGVKIYNLTDIYTSMMIAASMRFFATLLYIIRWRYFNKSGIINKASENISV